MCEGGCMKGGEGLGLLLCGGWAIGSGAVGGFGGGGGDKAGLWGEDFHEFDSDMLNDTFGGGVGPRKFPRPRKF